jgi:hypothetical protein
MNKVQIFLELFNFYHGAYFDIRYTTNETLHAAISISGHIGKIRKSITRILHE